MVIKGQIFGREDVYVDGEVEGTIELLEHRLTIGAHGKVHAGIKAREVVIVGTVHGNIEATDKIDIRKDAKLVGDIRTARIVIEDGAYFKGSIDIQKPEVSRVPAAPAAAGGGSGGGGGRSPAADARGESHGCQTIIPAKVPILAEATLERFDPGRAARPRVSAPGNPARRMAWAPIHERHSHGLEQFSSHLQEPGELCILDLGGITQANVSFITNLGHKLFSEDFLKAIDRQSGEESNPLLAELFLRENLSFPEARFDGVLLWDALEFLPPPVLKATVERLFKITKPGSYLLAFFHSDEKAALVPSYSYRITSAETLNLTYQRDAAASPTL